MSLIRCSGFEVQDGVQGASGSAADGIWTQSGTISSFVSYQAATRPGSAGTRCLRLTNGGQVVIPQQQIGAAANYTVGSTTTEWIRVWFRIGALPAASNFLTVMFMQAFFGTKTHAISVAPDGSIRVYDLSASSWVFTGSSGVIAANTWYKLDLVVTKSATAGSNLLAVAINGTTLGTVSPGVVGSAGSLFQLSADHNTIPQNGTVNTTAINVDFDDLTWRDNTGTVCKTAPDDNEQVTALVPTADSAIGAWTTGAGGATGLWDDVNNQPPVGVATATSTSQIKNASKTIPSKYTATCPVSAAVTAGSTELGINATAWYGSPQTKAAITVFPSIDATDSTFSTATGTSAVEGTWPSNWSANNQVLTLAGGTVAASHTLSISKNTASTSQVDCCALLGYLLTLAPAPAAIRYVAPIAVRQAVARAGSW